MPDAAPLVVNPALDWPALAQTYAEHHRVRIDQFLDDASAKALHAHLRAREDWKLVINSGDKLFELTRADRAAMPPEKRIALDDAVNAKAQLGFQYRYESIRVPDAAADRTADPTRLNQLASLLSSEAVIARLQAVTGAADVAFADAQGTAYAPGDFLTTHDDNVAGKHRRAAYVLGLTPGWRIDWGGLLLLHRSATAWVPRFNTLNLFAVPQPHSVSQVASFTGDRRFAVTGWLRAGAKP